MSETGGSTVDDFRLYVIALYAIQIKIGMYQKHVILLQVILNILPV
jgi:hypothetical protein